MEYLRDIIRNVPDFPKKGIVFKDITPILNNGKIFKAVIDHFVDRYKHRNVDKILAIESRGFIFGAAVAASLGVGFVPIRKPGKLPYKTYKEEYKLEYGTDAVEIHVDALAKNENVVVFDDVIATGGTALATCNLVKKLNAHVIECAFLIELEFLKGREKLTGQNIYSVLRYAHHQ
jgi:adenine phosphoribosyltransferase